MATVAPWTLTDQAHWLIQHEPNAAKRELLLQMLPVNTCTQVTALKRLLSANGSRFYKQISRGFGETGFNPIDALQRDYRLQDDWYFFSGIVKTVVTAPAAPRTYGFTVMFFADPIGGDRHNAVDYACETAMLLFTDVTNSKVFQSPIEKAVASSMLTRRAPFLFQHPTGNFGISATGNPPNPIFPLLLTARDITNDITLVLTLTPKFDETQPLFQGTADGFVGGAGMGYRYYSYPALATTGTVIYGPGRTSTLTPAPAEPVTGVTWMDHQNGTVGRIPNLLPWRFLAVDIPQLFKPARTTNVGWNWFAIMLDNSMSLATSFPRNVDSKTGQEILLTDPQPASYVSLQLPDGSSRPLKGKLTIQVQYGGGGGGNGGSYVTAAHFVGNDAELGDIDLVSQSLLPGVASAGWLPPMIPFSETPAAVTGSVGGVNRNGFGMLESVGVTDRYHLFANILQLGGLPATPQTVSILTTADFRTAQREGWMVLVSVVIFITLLVLFFKTRRRGGGSFSV